MLRLILVQDLNVKWLLVCGDSLLLIQQTTGEFTVKEAPFSGPQGLCHSSPQEL